jgi:3-dehydroquinate synthase
MDLFSAVHFTEQETFASFLQKEKRYALITDTHVQALYGQSMKNDLEAKGFDIALFSIPQGEQSKSREMKHKIEDAMLSLQFGRESCIIALGGGVVTDLAGFIAATYCRGISYISIPTTLLGMIDASIGGKTGVNTSQGKNLIGAFHLPEAILIDMRFLDSLPETEWKNGFAEMIKYGLIASSSLFDLMAKKDKNAVQIEIQSCIEIKRKTIETDFHEKGLRRILNFGHTLGHALETLVEYRIAHGQAVAMGIAFESFLSMRLGYLNTTDYQRILDILNLYGFRLDLLKGVAFEDLMQAMARDKKGLYRMNAQPRFVLLESIGNALSFEGQYCTPLCPEILREAYEQTLSH